MLTDGGNIMVTLGGDPAVNTLPAILLKLVIYHETSGVTAGSPTTNYFISYLTAVANVSLFSVSDFA